MNNKQKMALEAKFSDGLGSSGMMVSALSEWHDAKRRLPSADEAAIINSVPVGSCPRRGFSRDGLQDWLNLFYFYWNTPGDAFQKAQTFIELAVKKRKFCAIEVGRKRKIPINPEIFIPHVQIRV